MISYEHHAFIIIQRFKAMKGFCRPLLQLTLFAARVWWIGFTQLHTSWIGLDWVSKFVD